MRKILSLSILVCLLSAFAFSSVSAQDTTTLCLYDAGGHVIAGPDGATGISIVFRFAEPTVYRTPSGVVARGTEVVVAQITDLGPDQPMDIGGGSVFIYSESEPSSAHVTVVTGEMDYVSLTFGSYTDCIEVVAPDGDGGGFNGNTSATDSAVYPISTSSGVFFNIWRAGSTVPALVVTPDDIQSIPMTPTNNTLIAASADGYYSFYRLTTGELQLNVGPDAEGKIFVTIFSVNGLEVVGRYTIEADGSLH